MSIPPIKNNPAPRIELPSLSSSPAGHSLDSSIQSASSPSFVTRFMTRLKAFFYMLLQLVGIVNKPKQQRTLAGKPLGLQPSSLLKSDPFHQIMFDPAGKLRHPEVYQSTFELYDILGNTGYGYWIRNQNTILGYEKRIVEFKPHPLEFFAFMFNNNTITNNVLAFKNKTYPTLTTQGHGWFESATILAIRAIKDPWPAFMDKNIKNLKRYKADLLPYLPGFCKVLNLENVQSQLEDCIKEKQWDKFIYTLMEERRKHFNL